MARNEFVLRLKQQLADVDTAMMTATNGEVMILESLRRGIEAQLRALSASPERPQLKAA